MCFPGTLKASHTTHAPRFQIGYEESILPSAALGKAVLRNTNSSVNGRYLSYNEQFGLLP